ncbi:MAG TPA: class I SAM-dependent methyltransferase [Pirellulales bacterium]|jgi:SAM-dependent methyltransferase|nr:class I SAM-dependent methyltransferase [Pirellulales bacterium]
MTVSFIERPSAGSTPSSAHDTDHEKRQFYSRLPSLPIPLDRGRIAKAWLPSNAELLDIGCSAGYHVRHLVRKAKRVVAIDVDRVALEVARRRVKSSRVTFLHYDGQTLPFADASFDAVSMLDVLEHVRDRSTLVAEIVRVLRPGGTWTVTVPYRGGLGWLSPENMAADHPRLFALFSALGKPQIWIRGHNATGERHHHFSLSDLKGLVDGRMAAVRSARRGSLVYALCYLALCFPPRLFSRAWTTACFTAMAADYQVSYGPLAYNLAVQFRKPIAPAMPESIERHFQSKAEQRTEADRPARAA